MQNMSSTPPSFGRPVDRAPRLSDRVADLMLEEILSRGLRPGEALPSERELAEQYGVSRTVIREAVRSLAAKGLVSAQAGRGLCVAAVEADAVSASMNLYLRGVDELPYERVHEVRMAIETEVAELAAQRAEPDEIEELAAISRRYKEVIHDVDAVSNADVEFHRHLALLTHNGLFVIMLDSIGDVLLEIRRATLGLPDDAQHGYEQHESILAAVRAHDPQAARDAMRRHLDDAFESWRQLGPVPLSD
jgi:GntR family transcriptional repressor for pyruvate dehydrogenase complex